MYEHKGFVALLRFAHARFFGPDRVLKRRKMENRNFETSLLFETWVSPAQCGPAGERNRPGQRIFYRLLCGSRMDNADPAFIGHLMCDTYTSMMERYISFRKSIVPIFDVLSFVPRQILFCILNLNARSNFRNKDCSLFLFTIIYTSVKFLDLFQKFQILNNTLNVIYIEGYILQ